MRKRTEGQTLTHPVSDKFPEPLPCDRWIASSALQKSIRRGNTMVAMRAATSLIEHGWGPLWRRLLVIAVEDIGIGAVEACAEVTHLFGEQKYGSSAIRKTALYHSCSLLAEAPKDRSTDFLIAVAMHEPGFNHARELCGQARIEERIELAFRQDWSLPERAIAAWYASGIESWPERRVGRGDMIGLLQRFADEGAPAGLLEATRLIAKATGEPITVFLPLLWLALAKEQSTVVQTELPRSGEVDGIPLSALDLHTRLGREALSIFGRQNVEIATFLSDNLKGFRAVKALRYAAFFADSGLIRPRLIWRTGSEIERQGIISEFRSIKVDPTVGKQLIVLVREHLDELNGIRAGVFARAKLEGGV